MLCECCNKYKATQKHHKFHQFKWARRLYGKLLDDPRNIQYVCQHCHVGHASPDLIHWDEIEFCLELNIEPRSKENGSYGN